MINIIKNLIESLKTKLNLNTLELAYANNLTNNNHELNKLNITYFWQPSMGQPQKARQISADEPKAKSPETQNAEKMKMKLNNLKQKLGNNSELCSQIANLIDLIYETSELIGKLNQIDTSISVVRAKIEELKSASLNDCVAKTAETLNNVKESLNSAGSEIGDEYMLKIQKTIDYCVENYDTYKKSEYSRSYGKPSAGKEARGLSLENIALLLK